MITHCYNNENKQIMGVTDFNCKKGYSELVFDAFGDNYARGEARFFTSNRIFADFERLFALHQAGAFFVIRAKHNMQYKRRYSHTVDKSNGLMRSNGFSNGRQYEEPLSSVATTNKISRQQNQKDILFFNKQFHFEKTPLGQLLMNMNHKDNDRDRCNKLSLFDNLTGQ